MAYYDNINPELLELTPKSAKRICELGCGAGALAKAIKDKCSQLEYYCGIELDPVQAEIAEQYINKVIVQNLDQIADWNEEKEVNAMAPARSFDCVLIGDVLEHLFNPLNTLKQAASRLASDGVLIACIPNVQHWSVFHNLVVGNWPQDDQGLFDRTHIRWFTLDDMVKLFHDAGLAVISVTPREFPSQQGLSVMEDLEPLARNLGVDPDMLLARGQVLQFVLVGKCANSLNNI